MGQYSDSASTLLRVLIAAGIAALVELLIIDWMLFHISVDILKAGGMTVFLMVIALGAINKDIFRAKR
jgi:phosphate starvation-inducible membrane PsiE